MRLLLSKKSRKEVFDSLKEGHNSKTLMELSKKMKIPFKTLKKWRYAELYLPSSIVTKKVKSLDVIDKKEDNWGAIKGGKMGGKRVAEILRKRLGEEEYSKMMSQRGKKVINTLWKRYGKDLTKMAIKGKIKKRELQSKRLEIKNNKFFTNERISFNLNSVKFSKVDELKKINLPKEMSKELAEEIGAHLGDGCLLDKRNYFSIKCNKKEEEYITKYLSNLYKKLYNIKIKLRRLPSVSGFEIYSKAICEFKNKVIGLPYGKKVEKLEIPGLVTKTKDKEIYRAFIRGFFDTDGCIYMRNKRYPVISITIKSKKLMKQLYDMLKKLGFLPALYKWTISLNGPTMLNKWVKEINSKNPKNIYRLKKASSIVEST